MKELLCFLTDMVTRPGREIDPKGLGHIHFNINIYIWIYIYIYVYIYIYIPKHVQNYIHIHVNGDIDIDFSLCLHLLTYLPVFFLRGIDIRRPGHALPEERRTAKIHISLQKCLPARLCK